MVEFNSQYQSLPTTRQEAESTGSKWYYTGIPCVNGHVSTRYTSNAQCRSCAQSHGGGRNVTHRNRSIAEVKENISVKQRRNRIEEELELARIERQFRGYDE